MKKSIATVMLLILTTSSLICEPKQAETKWDRLNREVSLTMMRIRKKYPPTLEGKLKLWKDYKNKQIKNK